jgi:hypothetical protein
MDRQKCCGRGGKLVVLLVLLPPAVHGILEEEGPNQVLARSEFPSNDALAVGKMGMPGLASKGV